MPEPSFEDQVRMIEANLRDIDPEFSKWIMLRDNPEGGDGGAGGGGGTSATPPPRL